MPKDETKKTGSDIVEQVDPPIATEISTYLGFPAFFNFRQVSRKWRYIADGTATISSDGKQNDPDIERRNRTLKEIKELFESGLLLNQQNITSMQLPASPYTLKHTEEQVNRLYVALRDGILSATVSNMYRQLKGLVEQGLMENTELDNFVECFWECIRYGEGVFTALKENLIKPDAQQAQYATQNNISDNEVPWLLIGEMDITLLELAFSNNGLTALRNGWLEITDFRQSGLMDHSATVKKILSIALSDEGIQAMQNGRLEPQGLRLWTRGWVAFHDEANGIHTVNGIENFDVDGINTVADLQGLIAQTQQANNQEHANDANHEVEEQLTPRTP